MSEGTFASVYGTPKVWYFQRLGYVFFGAGVRMVRRIVLTIPSLESCGIRTATRFDFVSILATRWDTEVNGIPVFRETSRRFRGLVSTWRKGSMFVVSSCLIISRNPFASLTYPTFSVSSIHCSRFGGDGSASIIALYFAQKREEDELDVPLLE